ncbi:hypothetical protein MSAN_01159600 [Mycena sanguinolenta]|uniref:Uncharacterized protein n=1 Tax=Mycena sanguinolenta TaxID=230812 RepID=A0A8H7D6L2_9AGAR|nr:hypothetical protein MSAN_01159600 [Mycena sanguinolenta]
MTSLSAFQLVSQNLQSIGALSINDFLASGYEPVIRSGNAVHDPPASSSFLHNPNSARTTPIASGSSSKTKHMASTQSAPAISILRPSKAADRASSDSTESIPPPHPYPSLAQLQAICLRQFGEFVKMTDILKYEVLEEAAGTKRCILTITRPDGSSRSYKTEPEFIRKNDARARAATIAIEHGAIDFIVHGDSDELKAKKGVLVAPLENNQPIASSSKLSSESRLETPTACVREIDTCCREWRGDRVKPYWLSFRDSHILTNHGAVLKIQLAPHCWRVYSCQPAFDSVSEAREHCANLAIDEGVLEFIKHGNGQTAPKSDLTSSSETRFEDSKHDLQSFYESLPRPFAEDFGEKTVAEINASGYLSNLLVNAKGARFTAEFYSLSIVDDDPFSELRPTKLLGCLLRLERPNECRTYLAEPRFSTAKEAKAAVSLLAFSFGAGKWIREVTSAVETRVTPEMRRFAQATLFQALIAEAHSASGVKPRFDSYTEGDAFGCKLEVTLKPPSEPGERVRRYEVPAEYRTKADAKIGVAYLAFQQGVIDLLRNGGLPLPPGQTPAFSTDGGPSLAPNPLAAAEKKASKKRKKKKNEGAELEGPPAKKQKSGSTSLPPEAGRQRVGSCVASAEADPKQSPCSSSGGACFVQFSPRTQQCW